ncbi:MAG: aminotransferase class V-fold PLP-dependent enzyme, partial [Dehalococcoidia bacterium]
VNYLTLPAVTAGLRLLDDIGIDAVHERVCCLTAWLVDALNGLRHSNGRPLIRIHGPRTTEQRGGTIALSVLDPHGRAIDVRVIERQAAARNISLRTGCFCNPGVAEAAFSLSRDALVQAFRAEAAPTLDQLAATLGVAGGGAVRVSLGAPTNFADVYAFVRLMCSFLDTVPDDRDLPARGHC